MNQEPSEKGIIEIANPVSKEHDTVRTNLLPQLMETLLLNRSEEKPIRIFEVGDVILLSKKEDTGTKREIHLSAVTYHEYSDYTEMKSVLDFIMTSIGYYDNYQVKPGENPSYINGRFGKIYVNGSVIGEIGEIHPEVLINFKLEFPVSAFELNIEYFFDQE
jgi:phenylalanyl-tRNA synthetase beta chain